VFGRVETDQAQRVLKIRETLLGRSIIRTKALPAPFANWMQRRILQKLRGASYAPRMRRLSQLRMKLVQQPRLAQAWLADDYH